MANLVLRHVTKIFGCTTVLSDVSLEASDGEFVVVLGPSGCGKSTLLRVIAGLEPQTSGSVSIGDQIVDRLTPRDRDVAMVFQHYALYPHLTVRENLAFGLKMRKESPSVIETRIAEVAELLDVQSLLDGKPQELSGGQRQRVAIGRAIVRKPRLFLFDEPLSNLDARLRASTRVELKKLHQRLNATMVYVTHDQTEAMTLSEKIVVMAQGTIQQIGTPDHVYREPGNPFVAGFLGNPPMNLIEGTVKPTATHVEFQAGALTLRLRVYADLHAGRGMLGIRPEDVCLTRPGTNHLVLDGTVDVCENLGGDRLVHLDVHGRRLVARTSADAARNVGESVTAYVPEEKLHLFVHHNRIPVRFRQ